jgi:hypothetical protein
MSEVYYAALAAAHEGDLKPLQDQSKLPFSEPEAAGRGYTYKCTFQIFVITYRCTSLPVL